MSAFEQHAAELAARLVRGRPALALSLGSAPGEILIQTPEGVARVRLRAREARPAVMVTANVSLGYELGWRPTPPVAERLRAAVLALARDLEAIDTFVRIGTEAELDALAETRSGSFVVAPEVVGDPARFVDRVDRIHRAWLASSARVRLVGLPACLDLEMRPEALPAVEGSSDALAEPCVRCAAAKGCPTPRPAGAEPAPALIPLHHRDPDAAARVALQTVASAWDRPVPRAIDAAVNALLAARTGPLDVPYPPFELSLKREGDALAPLLRIVEYGPRQETGSDERAPLRREVVRRVARQHLSAPEEQALSEWASLLDASLERAYELTIGFEHHLLTGSHRVQLYAHPDPSRTAALSRAIVETLAWAGASPAAIDGVRDLLASPLRPQLALSTLSPAPEAPRRLKLYFVLPMQAAHEPTGLGPAPIGAFAEVATPWRLGVLEVVAGGVRWAKHDFPCAAHFQRAGAAFVAFTEGVRAEDRARAGAVLQGSAFAAWPTWLSVSAEGSAFYFVAR